MVSLLKARLIVNKNNKIIFKSHDFLYKKPYIFTHKYTEFTSIKQKLHKKQNSSMYPYLNIAISPGTYRLKLN
jgi:hypothetical protein